MARATNNHHLWYPRAWYKTPLERQFRNLPCNVVELQIPVHNLLHLCSQPPTKPLEDEMYAAIRRHNFGRCPCRERTHHELDCDLPEV